MNRKVEVFKLILSMSIFGSIGIFVQLMPYSKPLVAFARGVIGAVCLLIFLAVRRQKLTFAAARKHLVPLLCSGVCLGANWVLLFKAYEFTTVSVANICYYMGPIFASVAAIFLFREKMTVKKALCILVACGGLVLVSGVLREGINGMTGILLALAAAVLYASVMLLNRCLGEIGVFDRTILQLAISSVATGIYTACTGGFAGFSFEPVPVIMLIIVGIVHTGISYALYFGAMNSLPTQTVSIFSYIDPVLSIVLAAVILKETLTPEAYIGIVMVLGGLIVSEISFGKRRAGK